MFPISSKLAERLHPLIEGRTPDAPLFLTAMGKRLEPDNFVKRHLTPLLRKLGLAIELEQLGDDPSTLRNRVQELRKQAAEILNDVQALSHELHSSKLEYLGVVAGMKSWCKEFAERQKMEVDFSTDVAHPLPLEIGLCLFRVQQEALHNTVKHSGVKQVDVQLAESSNEWLLTISDSGVGFDLEAAKQGRGLGLTSMQERVRLVNGTITVESELRVGTTIHVRVPFNSGHASRRAAS